MRKLLQVSIVLFLSSHISSGVLASDLDMKPSMGADSPDEVYNWSGTFGTVFVGYNKTTSTATEGSTVPDDPANCAPAGTLGVPAGQYWCNVNGAAHYTATPTLSYNQVGNSWSTDTQGLTAGIEASQLRQVQGSNLVVGAAVDFNYFGNGGKSIPAPTTDDTRLGVDASSYATARGIVGYAHNRWLGYVTGGAAYGNFGNWVEDMDTPVGIRTSPTHGQWGLALGTGVAYALTDHLAIKGEFMMMDFLGSPTYGYGNLTCGYAGDDASVCAAGGHGNWKTGPLSNPPTGGFKWDVSQMMSVARVGLAYKF